MKKAIFGTAAGIMMVILFSSVAGAVSPGTLKWNYNTVSSLGNSSPAIGNDGTVYVGSSDGKFYAVNPNGTHKWSYTTGSTFSSTPAIGPNGTIYCGSYDGKLHALKRNGSRKWSYTTGGRIHSAPAIGRDGTIYVGSYDNKLYALYPNGSQKWNYTTGGEIYSSPAVGSDGTVYVGSGDNKIYAFYSNGSLKWNYTTGGKIYSSPAIGNDGTVYVGSNDKNLYAFNPDGTQKWSYTTGGEIYSSPAIGTDGTIYVGSGNILNALNPNGTNRWSFPRMGDFNSSPAIGNDGTIYAGSNDGKFYANYGTCGTPMWYYTTGGGVNSSPTIGSDGTLYFGSDDGKLYAVYSSSTGLANSAWPQYLHDPPHTGNSSCINTFSTYSAGFSAASGRGTINVVPSLGNCPWTASSNALWVTFGSGNTGTGPGTLAFSVAPNPTGGQMRGNISADTAGVTRTGTITIGEQTFTVTQTSFNAALYFPHIDTSLPWQTEIAVINTGDQTVNGTLRALSNEGELIETKDVTLPAHGRRQIIVAEEFTDHTDIGYIIFDTDSAAVQGYTKFYQTGVYRAAIPAVKEMNTTDIYVSHIDSSALWWTGASLVNTTSARKDLTITFNDGQNVPYTLNANEHKAFTIGGLLNEPLQPNIRSAVITNASGVIGLELFGSIGSATQMDGILLTDKTASTLYYPHVAGGDWWTGIVAYNPSESAGTITITPYSAQGTLLTPSTLPIAGKGKYVGVVAGLGLPAQTAWFRIDSSRPLSGFELFGTVNGNQVAAYAGNGGTGAKTGVFAKIEKNGGWTGIAFVNTEEGAASVTLTAYNDNGAVVATQVLPVGGHAKVVSLAEAIFMQDISGATYIAFSSDRNVVGFQLNGTSDGMMLDGLPGL